MMRLRGNSTRDRSFAVSMVHRERGDEDNAEIAEIAELLL
jgi:hypothetical protein